MSTHYIEEAERLGDTVTIMSHGKAVAVGPPRELIAEHAGPRGGRGLRAAGAAGRGRGATRSARGWRTRRTGTSVAILHGNGDATSTASAAPANLEDVFVLLTGEEIA